MREVIEDIRNEESIIKAALARAESHGHDTELVERWRNRLEQNQRAARLLELWNEVPKTVEELRERSKELGATVLHWTEDDAQYLGISWGTVEISDMWCFKQDLPAMLRAAWAAVVMLSEEVRRG